MGIHFRSQKNALPNCINSLTVCGRVYIDEQYMGFISFIISICLPGHCFLTPSAFAE